MIASLSEALGESAGYGILRVTERSDSCCSMSNKSMERRTLVGSERQWHARQDLNLAMLARLQSASRSKERR